MRKIRYTILVQKIPVSNIFNRVANSPQEGARTETKYIDQTTAKRIADLCPAGYREMLLIAIGTGYRISDICSMENWQYDRQSREFIAEEAKTDKFRVCSCPQWLAAVLAAYDKRHPERKWLVCQPGGGKISRQTAWRWIRRGFRELCGDDPDGIGPHSLRKCYAVQRRKDGAKLAEVQADLNHDKRSTTMIYYYADIAEGRESDNP